MFATQIVRCEFHLPFFRVCGIITFLRRNSRHVASINDIANEFIREEIEEFLEEPDEIVLAIDTFAQATPAMQDIAAALIDGDHHTVDELTEAALGDGTEALEIMDDGLIAGMGIVGIKFRENFIFVPEVLACARAMKAGMAHIEPILSDSGIEPIGTVIMGTVKGDLHDIGKNLCIMMLRGAGFVVHDLGLIPPKTNSLKLLRNTRHRF